MPTQREDADWIREYGSQRLFMKTVYGTINYSLVTKIKLTSSTVLHVIIFIFNNSLINFNIFGTSRKENKRLNILQQEKIIP